MKTFVRYFIIMKICFEIPLITIWFFFSFLIVDWFAIKYFLNIISVFIPNFIKFFKQFSFSIKKGYTFSFIIINIYLSPRCLKYYTENLIFIIIIFVTNKLFTNFSMVECSFTNKVVVGSRPVADT